MENKVYTFTLSKMGDEYHKNLANGKIAKVMKMLFDKDKHHLFSPFKMGYYIALIIGGKSGK